MTPARARVLADGYTGWEDGLLLEDGRFAYPGFNRSKQRCVRYAIPYDPSSTVFPGCGTYTDLEVTTTEGAST